MAINVKIVKGDKGDGKGDAVTMLKRFQKKMQESGVVPKVKSRKHASRGMSKLKLKKDKLVKLEAAKKYETLKKMGKLQVKTYSFRKEAPTTTKPTTPTVAK
jgi:ribosomal protein S21